MRLIFLKTTPHKIRAKLVIVVRNATNDLDSAEAHSAEFKPTEHKSWVTVGNQEKALLLRQVD